ncbi:3-dehydroquinate synthase [Enterococcus dongliensis]|uniref:3-dehydroquinate synthase n=1 Tax=Enterococcus dongliensis TaxID=2559925 RepID=A0AAP5KNZ6_9ENTE|nr:3-dehydroquinate synthase [Enterococcus dongliensis]MDT2595786.1 3-dehydroquinate synthase [Enterococcus dongliensis]MDT2602746.1 3-dehydroquinate synthase [Enterococcus dongliensis]MDT2633766.1 3-dehydroquinate synthase [Enterococcus dongliensis]MDT2636398.1 3-dehydroquinate synthase [Enterococcus dongliensis]MDT2639858.1 3-dehydroquinate synthase [Enterococcus dongliensis]
MEIVLSEKSYEIVVKRHALESVGEWIASLWQNKKIAIISDDHVFPIYGEKICQQLTDYEVAHYVIPAGENSKSLDMANTLYDFLADQHFTRSDAVIALGGGVVGDLASFVASTYMRGIAFVQIPTSLLAQVDSSIGGKTAVNSSKAKNMIGTFAQPDGVLIDPETLNTLPELRIREGIAEIIKCGAISDSSLWQDLEKLTGVQDLLAHSEAIILKALQVKKAAVEEDEFDNGARLLLNFGHTIGHAIENTAGYGKISHGEAVAIGMIKISQTAEKKHLSPVGITQEIIAMNQKYQLPIDYQPWEAEKFYAAITHDKKARGESLNIVLLKEIGKAFIQKIKLTEIKDYLIEGK